MKDNLNLHKHFCDFFWVHSRKSNCLQFWKISLNVLLVKISFKRKKNLCSVGFWFILTMWYGLSCCSSLLFGLWPSFYLNPLEDTDYVSWLSRLDELYQCWKCDKVEKDCSRDFFLIQRFSNRMKKMIVRGKTA